MPLPAWTPDLPALDLLLSVAELGSVGRAAEAHKISQPSASARLARLERRLGVSLLVRTSRGSSLTPAGEAVAAWARGVVDAAQALTDGVWTLRAGRRARLRVAASLTIAEYLMPRWLLVLRRSHPGLDIAVTVANSDTVCARVRTGRADIGFIEAPTVPPDLTNNIVGHDRLALVVAHDYPLASRAATGIAPRDLLDQPILLRERGSGTRDTFLHALARTMRVSDPRPAPRDRTRLDHHHHHHRPRRRRHRRGQRTGSGQRDRQRPGRRTDGDRPGPAPPTPRSVARPCPQRPGARAGRDRPQRPSQTVTTSPCPVQRDRTCRHPAGRTDLNRKLLRRPVTG